MRKYYDKMIRSAEDRLLKADPNGDGALRILVELEKLRIRRDRAEKEKTALSGREKSGS